MTPKRCVMVCVTRQLSCERLIREGAALSSQLGLQLLVVHVVHPEDNFLGNPHEGEALDYLFNIAKEYDAQISLIKHNDVLDSLTGYARDHHAAYIVTGQSPESIKADESLIWRLRSALPDVQVHAVAAQ
ncbi:MAG: universal stress protein UspA [Eubacteriales bacterium]|nr:universal stress protein UspA [Eubacteriales bacterium]